MGRGPSFVNQTSKGGVKRGCLFVCVCVFFLYAECVRVCLRLHFVLIWLKSLENMAAMQSVLPIATRHLTPRMVDPDSVAGAKLGLVGGSGDGGGIGGTG